MLQSGHGSRDRRMDRRTDRRMDRRTEWNQYTPQQLRCSGGIIMVSYSIFLLWATNMQPNKITYSIQRQQVLCFNSYRRDLMVNLNDPIHFSASWIYFFSNNIRKNITQNWDYKINNNEVCCFLFEGMMSAIYVLCIPFYHQHPERYITQHYKLWWIFQRKIAHIFIMICCS